MIREIWIGTCRLVEIYGNDIATAARGFVMMMEMLCFFDFAIGKQ